jgi:hypothetical protein
VALQRRWDEVFGHLALLMTSLGLWRALQFASLDHYAAERLGVCGRSVEQRAWLERRLRELPELRAATQSGLSYEKARLVARIAKEGTVRSWIGIARRSPCVDLRERIEEEEEEEERRQMCARRRVVVVMPARVCAMVEECISIARAMVAAENKGCCTDGEALERVAEHFLETWEGKVPSRKRREILARKGGRCEVSGCSRAATHVHHIVFRSRGGGDSPENEVGLCAAHHLHCVHLGWVRVAGRAPNDLHWETPILLTA